MSVNIYSQLLNLAVKGQFRTFCVKVDDVYGNELEWPVGKSMEDTFLEILGTINGLEDQKQDYWFILAKGFTLFKCGREKEAIDVLTKAWHLKLGFGDGKIKDRALALLADIKSKIPDDEKEAISLAEKAVEINQSKRNLYVLALTNYRFVMRRVGRDVYSLPLITGSFVRYEGLSESEKAISFLSKIVRSKFSVSKPFQMRGTLNFALRDYVAARGDFEYLIENDSASFQVYQMYWACFFKLKNLDSALNALDKSRTKFPQKETDILLKLGHTHLEGGDYNIAIETYEKALEIDEQALSPSFIKRKNLWMSEEEKFVFIITTPYLISILLASVNSGVIDEQNTLYVELENLLVGFDSSDKDEVRQFTDENAKTNVRRLQMPRKEVDTFKFGKYSGRKFTEIAETEPNYLMWCVSHIVDFVLDSSIFIKLRKFRTDSMYLSALEINTIKLFLIHNYGGGNLEEGYNFRVEAELDPF